MRRIASLGLVLCGFAASIACAQVNVSMPWVRGTLKGHHSTAAFMRLEAHVGGDVTLVAASSPLASSVELREMRRAKKMSRNYIRPASCKFPRALRWN